MRVDKDSNIPIYVQLEEQIRLLVHQGTYGAGDAMPTVRWLAVELGINANTVARVYRDLQNEKILVLKRGRGTYVANTVGEPVKDRDYKALTRLMSKVIDKAKELGIKKGELSQLMESLWEKENV